MKPWLCVWLCVFKCELCDPIGLLIREKISRSFRNREHDSLSLVSIWWRTCRDCDASVVAIDSDHDSTSTTLETQSRHVHDHMETRL